METFSMKKPFSVFLLFLLLSAAATAAEERDDDGVILKLMMQKCRETYHTITNIFFEDTRDMTFEEIQKFFRDAPDHRHYVYGWKSYRWAEYEDALRVFESCLSFEKEYKDYYLNTIAAQTPQFAPVPSPPASAAPLSFFF
ncbi:hypothetical protein M9H77_09827 [Catharanthus roseus]|uniref:Uncharacterized protein n=2 Tax=Catharanthus roseus TaxID=4058 RepID=A0ACC0C1Q6_CATRO|nr:hypothetical protein M9H77_09825 [Catharanthus roseus]KAI5678877.1 hypothetical protein M9H77_09827 [Catharanthus roseus]